ncbi:hypothetical protein [Nocardia sp. CDC160]|uniref:hypothetical protein n=1 Tax=Nocardia sp. CDC160 TaxID=3112166 RepID=UPI002DB5B076|nr:hypothetical protein [Nocardia sp. CDC160]MEC3919744.1 hypothetical protein [Nocardia sp. CDC160]
MSDEAVAPNAKGPAPVNAPATEVGTLLLTYSEDGVPTLTVSGGNAIPSGLTVVDATGKSVAQYVAGPLSTEQAPTETRFYNAGTEGAYMTGGYVYQK